MQEVPSRRDTEIVPEAGLNRGPAAGGPASEKPCLIEVAQEADWAHALSSLRDNK